MSYFPLITFSCLFIITCSVHTFSHSCRLLLLLLFYQPQFVLPSGRSNRPSLHCQTHFTPMTTSAPERAEDLGHTASTLNVNPNYSRAETLTFFLESEELRLFLLSLRPLCKHCDCRLQCVNVENAYGIVPYFVTLSRPPLSLFLFLRFLPLSTFP